jgi:four helix bundle protein
MQRFRFEKLTVWQSARALNRVVYRATKLFPSSEQFAQTSQLRRSSLSISSNIAEGAGRNSDRDFAHFLEQAYGSAMELASQVFLALDEDYLTQVMSDELLEEIQRLSAQIAALNRSMNVTKSKVVLPKGGSDATRRA